jgi:hypothetical protein
MDRFDINNPDALKLITETFNTGLLSIFNYYTALAHTRRSNAVSAEKAKQKEILRQNGLLETDKEAVAQVISSTRRQNLAYLKNLLVSQRDTISYKEYLTVSDAVVVVSAAFRVQRFYYCHCVCYPQFTQDFCIKSTALLTATQLGDIYLTVVPLQNTAAVQQSEAHKHNEGAGEGLMVAGMSFALFCKAIMYMALLAYRSLDPAVPTTYKVSRAERRRIRGLSCLVDWLVAGWLLVGCWLVDWLVAGWLVVGRWLVGGLVGCWLVRWLVVWLAGWSVGWLAKWLVGWSVGWLAGWLVGG